ncbi:ankyrin repeat-containing domain protein, partial [Rhypophila decipiens]
RRHPQGTTNGEDGTHCPIQRDTASDPHGYILITGYALSDQLEAAEGQDLDGLVVVDPALQVLRRAEAELVALVSDLGQLISSCQSGPSKLERSKVKRLKWLSSRGKISKLTERSRDIRLGLQQAMASLSLRYQVGHAKLLLEIRGAASPSQDSVQIPVQDGQVATNQHSDSLFGVDSPCDIAEEEPTVLMARQILDPKADDEILEIQTYLSGRCLSGCNCQCHYARTQSSTPMWLKSVLGTMSLSYNSIPFFRSMRCDNNSCRRSRTSSVSFNYYLPSWSLNRYLAVNIDLQSLVGPGASIQLPRIIPTSNAHFWHFIRTGNVQGIKEDIRDGLLFCPTDRSNYGYSIFKYGIDTGQYQMLDFFLSLWEPYLTRNGVPEDATALPRRHLALQFAFPHGRKTLEIIIALAQEQTEFRRSEINDAILKQDIVGLLDAISRNPTSINHLDEHGEAPIHQATRTGYTHLIRILIQNGADINRLSIDQNSALHIAAENGHLVCLRLLLKLGAAVDLVNVKGFTPTHTACLIYHPDQVEIVKALLGKKPSLVHAKDAEGNTPLMTLARYQNHRNEETFADTLKVILDAGADLEARNDTEHTAVGRAARTNSILGMAALLTAGARIDNVKNNKDNILHQAANSWTFQRIEFLHSWNLETLYGFHLGLRWNRDTPWETFRWRMTDTMPYSKSRRIPSRQDAVAFVRLFRKVRDESLQLDIDTLTSVLQHLQERNTELAIQDLQPLIQRKKRIPEMHKEAETFRVVGIQITQGMWDAAIESVEENIEVFGDEMKISHLGNAVPL